MNLWHFVAVLAVHWAGDFLAQSHWMSVNKSKRWDALLLHVAVYTIILYIGSIIVFWGSNKVPELVLLFVVVNGFLHFWTDLVSSQVTALLWEKKRVHDFFVVVGFDQLVHQATLAATGWWLL